MAEVEYLCDHPIVRLGELLDHKHLELRLLHDSGDSAAIEFERAFTTDLPDPTKYLVGGELVLSGLVFHSGTPAESEAFVDALVRSEVVALGAGEERFGHIPDHLVDACVRHGLTLFAVPVHVSFGRVTDEVMAGHAHARIGALAASLARQRQLLDAVASGRALDEMAVELQSTTGVECWIITATGRQVVAVSTGARTLDSTAVDTLTAAALWAKVFPIAVGEHTVLRVGSSDVRRTGGPWFLVVNRHLAELPVDSLDAFREFAAISGLVRARELDLVPAINRLADRVVDGLVAQVPAAGVRAALDDAGLGEGRDWIVLCAGIEGRPDLGSVVRASLRDVLIEVGPCVVGQGPDGEVIAVVDGTGGVGALEQLLAERLRRSIPILRGVLTVGLSEPSAEGRLIGALHSARYARGGPAAGVVDDAEQGRWVRVGTSEQFSSARTMFATLPDDARALFVERVLGPIRDHDALNGTDLVDTVRTFLDEKGSWNKAASRMHLHLNTVRYRIARVEELTGRDLSTTADRTDLYLALRAGE